MRRTLFIALIMDNSYHLYNFRPINDTTSTIAENDSENQDNLDDYMTQLEVNNDLKWISKYEYVGIWNINETRNLSPIMTEISGIVKTKLIYDTENTKVPTLKIMNTLYDGQYRDRAVYHLISINDLRVNSDDTEVTFVEKNKSSIKVSHGCFYTVKQDKQCYIDVSGTFTLGPNNKTTGVINLTSDGQCFPKSIKLTLDSMHGSTVSQKRVMNYAFLLNLILMAYCYMISKQCHEAEQNQTTALRISMFTLCWNTIWNFCCFNIHLSYSLQFKEYGYLAIPACMYFIL